jgi:hypothetical protein
MSIFLKLQEELDASELIPFDRIVLFKRVDATTYAELADLSIGTASYTDVAGTVNDEYHTIFRDSINGISSLPGPIYRALNPYKQRDEPDPPVSVILELDISSPIPTVDFIAVYRRKFLENEAIRIALLPIGQQFYQDVDGLPGDIYHTTFVDTTNATESQPSLYTVANANSGLVVVSGRFENPSGDAADAFTEATPDVEALLILPGNASSARTPTVQGQVIGKRVVGTRIIVLTKDELGNPITPPVSTGRWSIPLIPNNLIEPNNTYYEFHYRNRRYFKYVNSVNGAAQNFALLADVQPRFIQL